jgi:hypothetical protein
MKTGCFCPSLMYGQQHSGHNEVSYTCEFSPSLADRDYAHISDSSHGKEIQIPWVPVTVYHNEPRCTNEVEAHSSRLRAKQE